MLFTILGAFQALSCILITSHLLFLPSRILQLLSKATPLRSQSGGSSTLKARVPRPRRALPTLLPHWPNPHRGMHTYVDAFIHGLLGRKLCPIMTMYVHTDALIRTACCVSGCLPNRRERSRWPSVKTERPTQSWHVLTVNYSSSWRYNKHSYSNRFIYITFINNTNHLLHLIIIYGFNIFTYIRFIYSVVTHMQEVSPNQLPTPLPIMLAHLLQSVYKHTSGFYIYTRVASVTLVSYWFISSMSRSQSSDHSGLILY